MSAYEKINLLLSGIAIVLSIAIPAIQAIRRHLRKPTLRILPFEHQALTLNFNGNLNWVNVKFSIACENTSCIVRSVRATVTREGDGRSLGFGWSILEPVWMNWASTGSSTASLCSASYVRPLRLEADSLEPLSVSFEAADRTEVQEIGRLKGELYSSISVDPAITDSFPDYARKSTGYLPLYKRVSSAFFWVKGDYRLQLEIDYNAKKTVCDEFSFSVTDEQEQSLRSNVEHIVLCDGCPKQAGCPNSRLCQVAVSLR